jgi:hypothetical protein
MFNDFSRQMESPHFYFGKKRLPNTLMPMVKIGDCERMCREQNVSLCRTTLKMQLPGENRGRRRRRKPMGCRVAASLEQLQSDGQPELVVLLWWNFTATKYQKHPAQEYLLYCSSPHLYLPLWQGLRKAMDRKYG